MSRPRYKRVGNTVDEVKEIDEKSPLEKSIGKLFVIAIFQLVIGIVFMILFIAFMTGAHFSSNDMTRRMDELNGPIGSVLGRLTSTLDGLPEQQLENSLKQLFAIVANVKQLSSSATQIEPASVQTLMMKAENALASIHGSDIAQFASAAEHANCS